MTDILSGMMTEDEFLEHYGVKGMRWGFRKDDKTETSFRKSNKEEESKQKAIFSKESKRIHSELKDRGFNDLDSALLKAKYETPVDSEPTKGLSKKHKIAIGIGVGIAAAGVIAYASYKGNQLIKLDSTRSTAYLEAVDGLRLNWDNEVNLPKGSVLKRISTVAESKIRSGGFFACYRDDDVKSYSAILPSFWAQWGVGSPLSGGFINHYQAASEVKAPSGKDTVRIFKEVFESDWLFRNSVASGSSDGEFVNHASLLKDFSQHWVNEGSPTVQSFFSAVKEQGYNALIDFNDAGKLGKTPLRVIDSSIYEIVKNERLNFGAMVAAAENWSASLIHMAFNVIHSTAIGKQMSNGIVLNGMMSEDEFLAHYGVKGMRWGRRNPRNASYSDNQVKRDRQVYGKRGALRVNKSLNAGNSISVARGDEKTRRDSVMGKNKYVRQGGKIAGGAVAGVAGFLGTRALLVGASTSAGKQVLSKIFGNNASLVHQALSNPVVQGAAAVGAAKIGTMFAGDLAVSVNMRAHGYDPNRK